MSSSQLGSSHGAAWPIYRRLLSYAAPHWPIALLALAGMSVDAASAAGFSWLMQPLLDETFGNRDPGFIRWLPVVIVLLFLFRGLAVFAASYGMASIGRRVVRRLREEVFARYLALPAAFFDREAAGPLIARLTYNVEQVAEAATNAVKTIVQDSLTLLFLLALMLYLNAMLTLTAFVLAPAVALVIAGVSKRFRRYSQGIQQSVGDVTRMAEEVVQGHRVIKVFSGQQQEIDRFDGVNGRNLQQHLKMARTQALSTAMIQLIAASALAAIIYIATQESMVGELTAGKFTSLFLAMMLMLPSLKRLTNVQSTIQKGLAAAHSLFEVLDTAAEPVGGGLRTERVRGELAFDDVSLAYDPRNAAALDKVSFHVKAGSVTALVGRSGSGKTSLASLVPRFYDATGGEIRLDGRPLSDYSLDCLREQIALVSQEVVLFNDSIERNIAYGSLARCTREQIIEAARAANALEFIERLPDGLDTQVGEKGTLLSGGQRQRIAIARAILKRAPILILDEATSALDNESERLIQQALERIMGSCTTLVIAHRLSTVENADQLIVLDQGKVLETGTHHELLQKEGYYAALYRTQLQGSAEAVQARVYVPEDAP